MERPLYTPPVKPRIADLALQAGDEDVDPAALYSQVVVDKARLARHIRQALQDADAGHAARAAGRASRCEQGLAELVAYLQLGAEAFQAVVDETRVEHDRLARGGCRTARAVASAGAAAARDLREVRDGQRNERRSVADEPAGAADLSALVIPLLKGVIYREGDDAPVGLRC